MLADRAFFRGCGSFVDIAAVPAVPFNGLILLEDFPSLHAPQKRQIPGFMIFLHLGHLGKGIVRVQKPLLFGRFRKILVDAGLLEIFPGSCGF